MSRRSHRCTVGVADWSGAAGPPAYENNWEALCKDFSLCVPRDVTHQEEDGGVIIDWKSGILHSIGNG